MRMVLFLPALALALTLSACAGIAPTPTETPTNREAGFMTKPTVVCVVNKALQPVMVFVGEKPMPGTTEITREYWYWNQIGPKSARSTGDVTLQTGQTICTDSSDSDNTFTGPVDVKIRTWFSDNEFNYAYLGFNNPWGGKPTFYPTMTADNWFGTTKVGRTEIKTEEYDSYRCQTDEWNFNVLRLADQNGRKNWKLEILGPAIDWPEDVCSRI